MHPSRASRILLSSILDKNGIISHEKFPTNNLEYLEAYLSKLEALADHHRMVSMSKAHPPRVRGRSRDMYQNCMGLINGIKFGISFMLGRDKDLTGMEGGSVNA